MREDNDRENANMLALDDLNHASYDVKTAKYQFSNTLTDRRRGLFDSVSAALSELKEDIELEIAREGAG